MLKLKPHHIYLKMYTLVNLKVLKRILFNCQFQFQPKFAFNINQIWANQLKIHELQKVWKLKDTQYKLVYVSFKYSCLHFILHRQISRFDFLSTNNFFFIQAIIHIVDTTILSRINVDCVFLASHNNRRNHTHNNRKWLKQPQSHFH